MKDFENIGKKLPYTESQEYISSIIEKGIEVAINAPKIESKKKSNTRVISIVASGIAASIVGFLIVINSQTSNYDKVVKSESLTTVLSNMSDKQIMELPTYSLDEIPEY